MSTKRRASGARHGPSKAAKVPAHARAIYQINFLSDSNDGTLLAPEDEGFAEKMERFKAQCPALAARLAEGTLDVGLPQGSWQAQCYELLDNLIKQKRSMWFHKPVNPIADNLPDYERVIKNPMDLGTVRKRLQSDGYAEPSDFAAAVRLTFNNAMLYNVAKSPVHEDANKLLIQFERKYALIEAAQGQPGLAAGDASDAAAASDLAAPLAKQESLGDGTGAGLSSGAANGWAAAGGAAAAEGDEAGAGVASVGWDDDFGDDGGSAAVMKDVVSDESDDESDDDDDATASGAAGKAPKGSASKGPAGQAEGEEEEEEEERPTVGGKAPPGQSGGKRPSVGGKGVPGTTSAEETSEADLSDSAMGSEMEDGDDDVSEADMFGDDDDDADFGGFGDEGEGETGEGETSALESEAEGDGSAPREDDEEADSAVEFGDGGAEGGDSMFDDEGDDDND